MKKFIFTLLLTLYSFTVQGYDISKPIIESSPQRSLFYDMQGGWIPDLDTFLSMIDSDSKVIIHAHGCGGVGSNEYRLRDFYNQQGFYVILTNFLSRGDANISCTGPGIESTAETRNPDRIKARILEVEEHVRVLKNKGVEHIYISGHSEGGRVVQGITAPAKAYIIHGMDCKMREWWKNKPTGDVLVLNSSNDPWLTANGQFSVGSCKTFNFKVKEHWSTVRSHSALADEKWKKVLTDYFQNKR